MTKRIDVKLQNSNQKIIIDSENKQVTLAEGSNVTNGYNMIDHKYQTFIIAPPGKTEITAANGTFDIEFKKWVMD